jgi:hypothetical protein
MTCLSNQELTIVTAIRSMYPIAVSERHNCDITDVKVGGFLSFRKQNWKVLEKSKYEEVKWEKFGKKKNPEVTHELKLFSLKTGEIVYLEYSVDDELSIYITEKEVKLRDLNLSRTALDEISEEEEGVVTYNGNFFDYNDDESWAALYFKDESSTNGLKVRFYEFENSSNQTLTVELWQDEDESERPDREAFLSSELLSSEIVVLQIEEKLNG